MKKCALLAILIVILLGISILKSPYVQNRQNRSIFEKVMNRYGFSVDNTDYRITDFYHENSFTEQRYYFAVNFANDYPELPVLLDGLSDKMDETTVLEINGVEQILKERDAKFPTIGCSGVALKSKIIYLEGSNKQRYLIVIYDQETDLFHFLSVLL